MKKIIVILILIIIFMFSLCVEAVIRVEPVRIILYAEPGQRGTGTIEVVNKSQKEAEVWAILYDWGLDNENKLLTYNSGETDVTLAGLIKFNPRHFKIKPGKKQIVRFTVTAPEDIKKEKRGIVFFEEKTDMIDDKTGARLVTQIGTTIYFIPSTAISKFKVLMAGVHVAEDEDDEYVGLLQVENMGDVHIRYTVNYKIINDKDILITEGKLKEQFILPDMKKGLGFPIKKELEAGKYKMLLSISYSKSSKTTEYMVPFTVKEGT